MYKPSEIISDSSFYASSNNIGVTVHGYTLDLLEEYPITEITDEWAKTALDLTGDFFVFEGNIYAKCDDFYYTYKHPVTGDFKQFIEEFERVADSIHNLINEITSPVSITVGLSLEESYSEFTILEQNEGLSELLEKTKLMAHVPKDDLDVILAKWYNNIP